jgi:hypothetical protein
MAAALAAAAFMVAALAAADFTEAVLVAAVSVAAAWPRLAASTAVNSAVFAAADFMIAASGTATSRSVRGFYAYDYYDPYTYDGSYYDDSYYDDDDGSCYVVQRRVHTTHGWRLRPVQVCDCWTVAPRRESRHALNICGQ